MSIQHTHTEKGLHAQAGAWSKRIVHILLMSNGSFLGVTYNKPIRISSPIPFKSELRLLRGRFAI